MSNSPKVVFRVGKLKSWGEIGAAASHNLRTRPTPNANRKIDNVIIKPLAGADAAATVRDIIGDQTIRKNAVLAAEVIISASPEYFRPAAPDKAGTWDEDRLAAWRVATEAWIEKEFPNAASIVLHLDEATPHYQIIDVPLDDKGKLNCRGKYGGRETLAAWQDRAAEAVKSLGIDRGIPGSEAKHEKIKHFYAAVNGPTPELPAIKTPRPQPLPPPSPLERIPFTDAKRDREELEAKHDEQAKQHAKEFRSYEIAAVRAVHKIVPRSNALDLAQRQQKAAEATAAKLATEKAAEKAQADKLRALPLHEVLTRMYGAVEAKDSKSTYASRKFDLPDGRQIAVTDDKWIEQGGKGGKGAINLVMHLDGLEFKPAVRLMAEHYDAQALTAEATRRAYDKLSDEVKRIAIAEPLPMPVNAPERWPRVKQWLETVRGIPAKLVDYLHEAGAIYADKRGNAVFKREGEGVFIRGTGEASFKQTRGGKDAGTFLLEGHVNRLYLVEGPVDALAVKAMYPGATVAALGGNLVSIDEMKKRIPPDFEVVAAFDNDAQGQKLADEAVKKLGAVRERPAYDVKDWAEHIKMLPSEIAKHWRPDPAPERDRGKSWGMDR